MDTATTEIYTYGHTLSLHDALPIWLAALPQVATALGTSKAELVGEAEQAALQAAIVEKQTVAGAAVTQEMLAAIAATPVETSAFATLDRSADERLLPLLGTVAAATGREAAGERGSAVRRTASRERVGEYGWMKEGGR